MLTGRSSLLQVHQLYLREIKTKEHLYWRKGFRNANLGPDMYGMFRTKDINLMTINEVYIGGIYGLNTLTIAQWEDCKEEPYDSTQTCYDIILCAYKRLLKSNIIALADNAKLLVPTKQL